MTFEILLEQVFSFVMSKSIDKIDGLREQYTNQQILYLTIEQFAHSDLFKNEYREVTYLDCKDEVLAKKAEEISPNLRPEKIVENIKDIILRSFVTDDINIVSKINESIVMQYLSKNQLAISLLDISRQQRQNTDEIIGSIKGLQTEVDNINHSIEMHDRLRASVMKNGLGLKINLFINNMAKDFIQIATKKPPQYNGGSVSDKEITVQFIDYIEHLIQADFPNVTENYYQEPIVGIVFNPNDIWNPQNIEVDLFVMMQKYRMDLYDKVDELLKYLPLLPENFLLVMMDLMHYVDGNLDFKAHETGMDSVMKNAKPANGFDQVAAIKTGLKCWAEHLLALRSFIYEI